MKTLEYSALTSHKKMATYYDLNTENKNDGSFDWENRKREKIKWENEWFENLC